MTAPARGKSLICPGHAFVGATTMPDSVGGFAQEDITQGIVTIQDASAADFYEVYTGHWTGSRWMGGCRDSACAQSYRQIQSFKR
jgi:hypothetical protein